jgi:hypothetical protein
MNGIVDVFQASVTTRLIDLPGMIAEGGEVFVIRIVHQDIDGALEASELRGHGVEDLAFF